MQSNPGLCTGEPGTIDTFIDELHTGGEPVSHIGKQAPFEGLFLDEHRGCPAHLLWYATPVALGGGWRLEQLCDSATSHLGI